MISHHCDECGERVTEWCPAHPNAPIVSVVSRVCAKCGTALTGDAWNWCGEPCTKAVCYGCGTACPEHAVKQ